MAALRASTRETALAVTTSRVAGRAMMMMTADEDRGQTNRRGRGRDVRRRVRRARPGRVRVVRRGGRVRGEGARDARDGARDVASESRAERDDDDGVRARARRRRRRRASGEDDAGSGASVWGRRETGVRGRARANGEGDERASGGARERRGGVVRRVRDGARLGSRVVDEQRVGRDRVGAFRGGVRGVRVRRLEGCFGARFASRGEDEGEDEGVLRLAKSDECI